MNEMMIFNFHGKTIRSTMFRNEPWFAARDVADRLEYSKSAMSNMTTLLVSVPGEWKGSRPITTPGGTQKLLCLSEQGLYFFLARSDKPKALPFQKWIAGEVIPSIRTSGKYAVPGAENAHPLTERDREIIRETVQAVVSAVLPSFADQQRSQRKQDENQSEPPGYTPQVRRRLLNRNEGLYRLKCASYPITMRRLARALNVDPNVVLRHCDRVGMQRTGGVDRAIFYNDAKKVWSSIYEARKQAGRIGGKK